MDTAYLRREDMARAAETRNPWTAADFITRNWAEYFSLRPGEFYLLAEGYGHANHRGWP